MGPYNKNVLSLIDDKMFRRPGYHNIAKNLFWVDLNQCLKYCVPKVFDLYTLLCSLLSLLLHPKREN